MNDTTSVGSPPTAPLSAHEQVPDVEEGLTADQRDILEYIAAGGFDDLAAICSAVMKRREDQGAGSEHEHRCCGDERPGREREACGRLTF
jgi:hypothetical protein